MTAYFRDDHRHAGVSINQSVNKAARETMCKLITLGAKNGYGEYRTPPLFQNQVMGTYSFNNNILRRFCETLKDAVDPNGIIAPGRGGLWAQSNAEGWSMRLLVLAFATICFGAVAVLAHGPVRLR